MMADEDTPLLNQFIEVQKSLIKLEAGMTRLNESMGHKVEFVISEQGHIRRNIGDLRGDIETFQGKIDKTLNGNGHSPGIIIEIDRFKKFKEETEEANRSRKRHMLAIWVVVIGAWSAALLNYYFVHNGKL